MAHSNGEVPRMRKVCTNSYAHEDLRQNAFRQSGVLIRSSRSAMPDSYLGLAYT